MMVVPAMATVFLDPEGVDDEPGQKDLNMVEIIYVDGILTNTNWNWDNTTWSGANTGDACGLFDSDNDGYADYALCVTVGGAPAGQPDARLYSCGDTRADRCDRQFDLIPTIFDMQLQI